MPRGAAHSATDHANAIVAAVRGHGALVIPTPRPDSRRLLHSLLAMPASAAATPTISSVSFLGSPANPSVQILGAGFGAAPPPTNVAYTGYTGYDYGNALYVCDGSNDPHSFCAGQNDGTGHGWDSVGLVVNVYADTYIYYALGSTYTGSFYPKTFAVQPGDAFSVTVAGTTCSGTVSYAAPVTCGCANTSAASATAAGHNQDPSAWGSASSSGGAPVLALTSAQHAVQATAHNRVFSAGQDEIAIAPGRSPASAYYHFVLPASQPFAANPSAKVDPIIVDSNFRTLLVHITAPGGCELVLTGRFGRHRLRVSRNGRRFSLRFSVPLTNLPPARQQARST